MIYIIAYKLCRKNARRKIYAKMHFDTQYEAEKQFEFYVRNRPADDKPKEWELLTGDWKHIAYFCNGCNRIMNDACIFTGCRICIEMLKRVKGNEENGKS